LYVLNQEKRMKKSLIRFGLPALLVLLAACSSKVPLSEAPVTDLKATTPQAAASAPQPAASAAGERAITPVALDDAAANKAGPQGVAKVIYFDYDSFTIKDEFKGTVEAHAKFLAANRARKMVIDGHTDERGGREYNLALGQKRSEAVRRALLLLGVTDAQMEAISYGEEKPAANGASEEAWAKNRRAELNYR
jgi:peptidoglycan-associated lipoprotein